ncbi:MAG: DNA polymerase III subunit beta [Thermoanaerobacteraceae bacterium]|nr:DNA polymerase III subunit beta [Thermoanaerobacteraceae bacterium]
MRFSINKNQLITGISTVEKFVPSKSTVSILSGIKFSIEDDSLRLTATDLEMGIEYEVKKAPIRLNIIEEGSAVISSKILSEIVRRMPGDMVEFTRKENTVLINSGDFNMKLPCFDAEDFPEISKINLSETIILKQRLFKEMIKQTIFARADETTSRPQLTGILIDFKENILNMVALDGFRVAWRYEEQDMEETSYTNDFKVIVPSSTMLEISRIFKDDDEADFKLYAGTNRVEFKTENILISSRVLEGDFIDYEKVMNIESDTIVEVDTGNLQSAVERANIIAREGNKNNLVIFNIADNFIEVKADTELGSISDKVSCDIQGEKLTIAFNARFFIDALRTIDSPQIKLNFSGSTGPCIITPKAFDKHKNFILPVKLGDNF